MTHILCIEPDDILGRTYVAALSDAGHQVVRVADAQAAIDAADAQLPDLVLLELQLPIHNGVEFLYEFRSYPEWQDIPVIVQSLVPAHEFGPSSALWRELGVVAYHYKPRTSLLQLRASVDAQLAPIA